MKKLARIVAIVLLFILGITAVGAAVGFLADPSGASMRVPSEFIKTTPFKNYIIPGILLLSVNGLPSITIAILVIQKVKLYPILIVFQGMVLILWLSGELVININAYFPIIHIPCFTMGILLVVIGWWLRSIEQEALLLRQLDR